MLVLSTTDLIAQFPFANMRPTQKAALEFIASHKLQATVEMPTGEGKTAVAIACLKAAAAKLAGPVFYIVPSKTLVDQIAKAFPDDVMVVLGRSEYECLYYTDRKEVVDAAQSPCYMLQCKHRVNAETGEVEEPGATPCPYLQTKFEAKTAAVVGGKIIVTTMAFFMMNRFAVPDWRALEPALVVIDEAHDIADTMRRLFEWKMSHDHLWKVGDILMSLAPEQADKVYEVAKVIQRIAKTRKANKAELLKEDEIKLVIEALSTIDVSHVEKNLRQAIEDTELDTVKNRGDIKVIESIIRTVPRFLRSLDYALKVDASQEATTHRRNALNFVVAYRLDDAEIEELTSKSSAWIGIRSYFVGPIVRKAIGDGGVVNLSATIGNDTIFGHESGLRLPFLALESAFPVDNSRILLPKDAPDLAYARASNNDPKKAQKMIVDAAKRFAAEGIRSLILVVSNEEREAVLRRCKRDGLEVITYGDGLKPKAAAALFKSGKGQALLGTKANYGQGVDLPAGICPVIFDLRPAYAPPDDPMRQFESRRFPESHVWALQGYRAMLRALQVRGRNIRSAEDIGVCFFISQQFRKFVRSSLPKALQVSYRDQLTMQECIEEALKLLKPSVAAK